jgi:hypothetical protein
MKIDETRLRDLLVRDRLHELEMAYCRGVDRRDPELLRSIFFDDAVEEHGDMFRGSADEFAEWVFASFLPAFENTTHYVLNEWYRVDGDRAEGETHRISYHRPVDGAGPQRFAACRTFTRYECRDDVWRIAHRSVVRDWIVDEPADVSLLRGRFVLPLSEPGESDASYASLGLFGRGPVDRPR